MLSAFDAGKRGHPACRGAVFEGVSAPMRLHGTFGVRPKMSHPSRLEAMLLCSMRVQADYH